MRPLLPRRNPATPAVELLSALWLAAPRAGQRWLDAHEAAARSAVQRAQRARFAVVAGGGESGAAPGTGGLPRPVAGENVDLAERLSRVTDPRYREVLTATGGGVPMTGIELSYTETGLLPEHYPFRSIVDAQRALEWINRKVAAGRGREFASPYYKGVVEVTWADGSKWRGRFDADGVGTSIPDLFGDIGTGGGVTWENTTQKGKAYARDTVFHEVPAFVPPSPAGDDKSAAAMMAAFAQLKKKDWTIGQIYSVPRHGRQDDTFQEENRWYKVISLKDPHTVEVELLREGEAEPARTTMSLGGLLELPRERDKHGYNLHLWEWPKDSGARRLRDFISGGAGPENAVIKAVLEALAPGTRWSVRSSSGTAYGWTHVKGVGGSTAQADAAVKAMNFSGDSSDAMNERYHLFVPGEAVAVARAAAERAKALAVDAATRKVAKPAAPAVVESEWRPGDILVRTGYYTGAGVIDVVRVLNVRPQGPRGVPRAEVERLAQSDTHRGKRFLRATGGTSVSAPDFTPANLERKGGDLVRKYLPSVGDARILFVSRGGYINGQPFGRELG